MRREIRRLYDNMLNDFQKAMELEQDELQSTESRILIAIDYWSKLKLIVKERGFKDENDEIDFFRNVKPRFTSYIEYMALIKDALLAIASDETNKISLWKKESDRLKKFYDDNISFIVYYNRKSHDDDLKFFLRKNNDIQNIRSLSDHDNDPEYFASHDHLVTTYLAYNMYAKYARKKLWELTGHYR